MLPHKRARSLHFSLLAIFAIALVAGGGFPTEAEAKDYYFPEVRVAIAIQRDGSFTVDEFRTYDFEGNFSWATLWIPKEAALTGSRHAITIEDFKVLDEDGRALPAEVSVSSGKLEARWDFQARNERRTFHFHYRVLGAIISYPDVSELYWKAIGDDWDRPTGRVTVTVTLPEPVENRHDMLVYGHGPLSGRSEIVDNRTARFMASNLPAFQFLEVRLAWPAGLVAGVPSNLHTCESIRQEEARFVQETIERIKREQEKKERQRAILSKVLVAWTIWLGVSSLAWLLIFVCAWKKVGRDYRFEDIPDYFRESPSDLRPALVEVLMREGKTVTPRAFTATLFDLARRRHLELEDQQTEKPALFGPRQKTETTITLKKDYEDDAGLLPYEKDLLGFLFRRVARRGEPNGAKLSFDELKGFLKKKPQTFQEWYRGWTKKIDKEARKLQFIEPKSLKVRNVFLAATIPVAVLTVNPVLGLLAAVLIPRIKRRSERWARENELWRALDRFLDDFSSFKDLPAEAYKLWEHYLVFGILFGNAKKILQMLPVILKDEQAAIPVWYRGFDRSVLVSNPGRIVSLIKNIESASSSLHAAATSAAHYSSGSGGGFSGGGGRGGGGGGGRAG
ncbi:MAG: DUF2207 domain-containing protein [Candidatus Aminicenantes bacterium]|nr:DUF2207 domain-containing protein [Candidatus Aminicenantes bacterium]